MLSFFFHYFILLLVVRCVCDVQQVAPGDRQKHTAGHTHSLTHSFIPHEQFLFFICVRFRLVWLISQGSWAVSHYVHLSVLTLSHTREPSSVAAEALFQFKYASDVTCVDLRQQDIPECISIWSVTAVESPYFCSLVVIKDKGGKAPPLQTTYILHIRSGGQVDVYRL